MNDTRPRPSVMFQSDASVTTPPAIAIRDDFMEAGVDSPTTMPPMTPMTPKISVVGVDAAIPKKVSVRYAASDSSAGLDSDSSGDGVKHIERCGSVCSRGSYHSWSGRPRASMIDDEIKDAWITKGWTMRQSMLTHGMKIDIDDILDEHMEVKVQKLQSRFEQLVDINKMLHSTLIKKKTSEQELRARKKELDNLLAAAQGVEDAARQMSLFRIQDEIRKEERLKQDMQLDLSQRMTDAEEQTVKLESSNESLLILNGQNKKLLREQQAEIKERQKAIRHLTRQIQVLEGAGKSLKIQEIKMSKRPSTAAPAKQGYESDSRRVHASFAENTDATGQVVKYPAEQGRPGAESEDLLRGREAAALLKEKKARLLQKRAHSCMNLGQNDGITALTIDDYKALPGLNLEGLLAAAPSEGTSRRGR